MPLLIFVIALLSGCAASVTTSVQNNEAMLMPAMEAEEEVETGSGKVFIGKISTVGALNSRRSFVSEYHGEVHIEVLPNRKIECRFWTEGRITDETIYEGYNGFVEAFSTLCTGRLQRDGTFEFQGAFLFDGPGSVASGDLIDANEEEEQTFTMRGQLQGDEMIGDIIIGGLFRNAVVIADPSTMIDTGEGVRFAAALLP